MNRDILQRIVLRSAINKKSEDLQDSMERMQSEDDCGSSRSEERGIKTNLLFVAAHSVQCP